jgi:hypothetical protein
MAFTGTPVVKQISDRIVRITGLSLAGSASGTIGLNGATGTPPDVRLPVGFLPAPYAYDGGGLVTLADSVKLEYTPTNLVASFVAVDTTKSGTTTADFRITLHNSSGSASPDVEMYVSFHE